MVTKSGTIMKKNCVPKKLKKKPHIRPFSSKRGKRHQQERYESKQRKRHKIEKSALTEPPGIKRTFFHELPFELLDMILSYCPSQTVLSLARTSKWMCITLTNHRSAFIWKRARILVATGPVPDPLPNIPEPAYAAILFDGGLCHFCKKEVKVPPKYFYNRIWVCSDNRRCNNHHKLDSLFQDPWTLEESKLALGRALEWMPYYPSRWGQGVFLRSTVESAKARILTINADSEEIKKLWDEEEAYLVQRKPVIDEYNWAYSTWEKQHIGYRSDAIAQNQDRWYHEAERAGWTQADARKSLSLKELLKTKKRLNAFMTDDDWEFYFPRISAEIDQIRIKRESLELEHKRQQHRQAVIDFLNKLKSRPATYRDFPIHLPSPDVFRKLPVVESFEQNTEIKWLSKKLEQKDITVAIKGDLEKWLARMRKVFADKLGFKAKDVALLGKEVLHPTERLTALFECKKCGKNGRIYDQSGGSLTFHEVVAHVCPKYAVKNEKERKWDLAKFTVDKVAVEVVREAIRIGGWDEAKSTKKRIAEDGTRFECKECGLNMVFDCLVGHAKRHLQTSPVGKSDDGRTPQEIPAGGLKTTTNEIPPERIIEAGTEVPPLRFSLSKYSAFDSKPKPYPNLELLMMDIPQYNGLRQKPIYYCLHCPEEVRKKRKGYTINGLRSHLKTLHKVKTLRSEDFFGEEQKPAKEKQVHSKNEQMARQQGDMNESERMLAWLIETTGDGNVHAEVEPQQHAL